MQRRLTASLAGSHTFCRGLMRGCGCQHGWVWAWVGVGACDGRVWGLLLPTTPAPGCGNSAVPGPLMELQAPQSWGVSGAFQPEIPTGPSSGSRTYPVAVFVSFLLPVCQTLNLGLWGPAQYYCHWHCAVSPQRPQGIEVGNARLCEAGGAASAGSMRKVVPCPQASNIDDVLGHHTSFLDTCLKDCMLTNPELLKVFSKLMSVCVMFTNCMQVRVRRAHPPRAGQGPPATRSVLAIL